MQTYTHDVIDPITGTTLVTIQVDADVEPSVDFWTARDAAYVDSARPRTLAQAQADATARINSTYQPTLDAGITVGGITLAAGDSDQQKFTGLAVLLREAEELGQITDSDDQTITDAAGQPQTMTVAALRSVLVSYGLAIQALFNNRAAKLAAIAATVAVEDADAITW